jgi:hypothetical protein
MALRFFTGLTAGVFRFRLSKVGFDASTADEKDCLIYEGMTAMVPFVKGSLTISPRASTSSGVPGETSVNVGKTYSQTPMIVLKSNTNTLPSRFSYWCRLETTTGILTVYNWYVGTAIIVDYHIYEQL